MTATETIVQCPLCLRFVCAGEVVAVSPGEGFAAARDGRLVSAACGRDDCGDCAADNAEREAQRRKRKMVLRQARREERQERAEECRPARAARVGSFAAHSVPPEREQAAVSPALPPARPLTHSVGEALPPSLAVETARTLGQRAFEERGTADSANEMFAAWFRRPENFRKGFTKKFLEDVVMRGKSGCCNNRAKDCRARYEWGGNYIDNWMEYRAGRLQSHYGLFPIEECKSLSDEQKRKLCAYPKKWTGHECFEHPAARQPDNAHGRTGLGVRTEGHGIANIMCDVEWMKPKSGNVLERFCPMCGEKINHLSSMGHHCKEDA